MGIDGSLPLHDSNLPVAVDVMGGDKGVAIQIEGAVQAYREYGVRSILVGPAEELRAKIDAIGAGSLPLSVAHAPEVITMHESPVRAVRKKPDSSLCAAFRLVRSGQASSVISAGHSGAMMAAGRLICGLLPGIERPAITTLIPCVGDSRPNVVLDTGANVDCHARNLVQFALMGAIYYSTLFDIRKPKVALLSNGVEPSKGTDVIRAASTILAQMESLNYVGFVEGRDVATHTADVIVCDGFVGNVLLKSMEGCVRLIFNELMYESDKGLLRMLGRAISRGVYREVFSHKFDYTAHGGSPLLGLNRLGVVLHGSSGSRAVKNAIRVADWFDKSKMIEKMRATLTKFDESTSHFEDDIPPDLFSKPMDLSLKSKRARRSLQSEAEPGKTAHEGEESHSPGESETERARVVELDVLLNGDEESEIG